MIDVSSAESKKIADRLDVPDAVKRILCQEAGFGCCFCGHPFIAFHHIVPWAQEQHMTPEDMMAVCDNCHRVLTGQGLTVAEQRQAKARPKNIADGFVRGHLFITSDELHIHLGGTEIIDTPRLITISGQDVLSARKANDGRVEISARIADSAGNIIAAISGNDWHLLSDSVWDFEARPKEIIVREAARQILFRIDCRSNVIEMNGKWYANNAPINFGPQKISVGNNNVIQGGKIIRCGGAFSFG